MFSKGHRFWKTTILSTNDDISTNNIFLKSLEANTVKIRRGVKNKLFLFLFREGRAQNTSFQGRDGKTYKLASNTCKYFFLG